MDMPFFYMTMSEPPPTLSYTPALTHASTHAGTHSPECFDVPCCTEKIDLKKTNKMCHHTTDFGTHLEFFTECKHRHTHTQYIYTHMPTSTGLPVTRAILSQQIRMRFKGPKWYRTWDYRRKTEMDGRMDRSSDEQKTREGNERQRDQKGARGREREQYRT